IGQRSGRPLARVFDQRLQLARETLDVMDLEWAGVIFKRNAESIIAVVDHKLDVEAIDASVTFIERELHVTRTQHLRAFVKFKAEREKTITRSDLVPREVLLPSLRFVFDRRDLLHEVFEREIVRDIGA